MDVIEAIYHRRSGRSYRPEPVAPELVNLLVAAAVQAPSAMNLQPWAFLVIEGRDALSEYSERAKRHLCDTLTPQSLLYRYRDQLLEPAFDIFYAAPLLIVVAATSGAAQSIEDCGMAAQNLMLAACREGLGSCCIGFARPWLNLPATKVELGISQAYVPVLPIILGYPRTPMPLVPRKRPEVCWLGKRPASSIGQERSTESGNPGQLELWQFEEPAATAMRDDPGIDVAPTRYDAPPDPHAPARSASLEACGASGDDIPAAADLDGPT
jgi:nitroreductase